MHEDAGVEQTPPLDAGIETLRSELGLLLAGDANRMMNILDATLALIRSCHAAGFSRVSPSADISTALALVEKPVGSWIFDSDVSDYILRHIAIGISTKEYRLLVEAAQAMLAAAVFFRRSETDTLESIHSFEATLSAENFLAKRQAILNKAKDGRSRQVEALTEPALAEKDKDLWNEIVQAIVDHTAKDVLHPNEFPDTMLGFHVFIVATRPKYGRRVAALVTGVLHGADVLGPLIRPDTQVPEGGMASTLVIAFSSLGFGSLKRPEWGRTLAAAKKQGVVVMHAMDTQESWYCGNPFTGEIDGGKWWDEKLSTICAPYSHVCLLGDSMGGTAALRFARHAKGKGNVVVVVPQIDLLGWDHCRRTDFTDAQRSDLHRVIVEACTNTHAHIFVHVGTFPLDVRQSDCIRDLPNVEVVRHEHIEHHCVSPALNAEGILEQTVLGELFPDNQIPIA